MATATVAYADQAELAQCHQEFLWGPAAADLDIHAAASLLGLRANPVYVKLPHSSVPLGLDDPRVAQFFSQNPTIRKGAVMFVSQIAGLTQEDMFNMAEGAVGCPPSIPASLAVPAHFQLHHLVTRFDPKDKRAGGQVGQAHVQKIVDFCSNNPNDPLVKAFDTIESELRTADVGAETNDCNTYDNDGHANKGHQDTHVKARALRRTYEGRILTAGDAKKCTSFELFVNGTKAMEIIFVTEPNCATLFLTCLVGKGAGNFAVDFTAFGGGAHAMIGDIQHKRTGYASIDCENVGAIAKVDVNVAKPLADYLAVVRAGQPFQGQPLVKLVADCFASASSALPRTPGAPPPQDQLQLQFNRAAVAARVEKAALLVGAAVVAVGAAPPAAPPPPMPLGPPSSIGHWAASTSVAGIVSLLLEARWSQRWTVSLDVCGSLWNVGGWLSCGELRAMVVACGAPHVKRKVAASAEHWLGKIDVENPKRAWMFLPETQRDAILDEAHTVRDASRHAWWTGLEEETRREMGGDAWFERWLRRIEQNRIRSAAIRAAGGPRTSVLPFGGCCEFTDDEPPVSMEGWVVASWDTRIPYGNFFVDRYTPPTGSQIYTTHCVAQIVAYLSAETSDFCDDRGVPAALWRVKYVTGELRGQVADLELRELVACGYPRETRYPLASFEVSPLEVARTEKMERNAAALGSLGFDPPPLDSAPSILVKLKVTTSAGQRLVSTSELAEPGGGDDDAATTTPPPPSPPPPPTFAPPSPDAPTANDDESPDAPTFAPPSPDAPTADDDESPDAPTPPPPSPDAPTSDDNESPDAPNAPAPWWPTAPDPWWAAPPSPDAPTADDDDESLDAPNAPAPWWTPVPGPRRTFAQRAADEERLRVQQWRQEGQEMAAAEAAENAREQERLLAASARRYHAKRQKLCQ